MSRFLGAVDISRGKIVGAEALLRWHHPTWGNVPPGKFIPIAEEHGLIESLGEWVLREAAAQASRWQRQGYSLTVSVNVSPQQLNQELVSQLGNLLHKHQLRGSAIELELTETAAMHWNGDGPAILNALKALGVTLALDDFGSGYSSLQRLALLPFDVLKIDKGLVDGVPTNERSKAIIRATIAMTHELGLSVVAEGVEYDVQLAFLETSRCDEVQGYLFAKPLIADELECLLGNGDDYHRLCDRRWVRMLPSEMLAWASKSNL